VLRVVTSNNPELLEHLDAPGLQSICVEHVVAHSYGTALELLKTKHPHIAIFDAERAEGTGYDLCRETKSDPSLNDIRFIIVLDSVVTRVQLDKLQACGCDDVLALPLRTEDFFHHVVQVAGLPHRQHGRVGVDLSVEVVVGKEIFVGTVDNMSLGGIGVSLDTELPEGELVGLRLRKGQEQFPEARAKVMWTRKIGQLAALSGLSFAEMPVQARLLVEELCLYDIRPLGAEGVLVTMHGDIVETTDFSGLAERLEAEPRVEFNLREVRRMSSYGVRSWCEFLKDLGDKAYAFHHASTTFTTQCAMVPQVAGAGEVRSFEAPYRCDNCDTMDVRLLESASVLRAGDELIAPMLRCNVCGGELIFDDVPFRYFAFVVRQRDW